ncbi:hypothetical protein EDD21DRAFT_410843 [Dissophora ornata]|nr:hypothetical protein BGZ58_000534 [Dissophora ornata]KAI8605715.1 hypothetical protein EDD21DRAFT_410843 [Dissophora ornata]
MNMDYSAPAFGATERLLRSADSLDFALSSQDKKNAGLPRQSLLDFGSLDPVFGSTELSASLFDDWLSSDLQQAGFTSQEDSSSDSESNTHSPILSSKSDSPAFGFDSIASDSDLVQSPGFEPAMAFFPEMPSSSDIFGSNDSNTIASANDTNNNNSTSTAATNPLVPLTSEAVQQAAAALNIPWSKSLEQAILAQSLLASLPMALPALALRQPATQLNPLMPQLAGMSFASAAAAAFANMMPNHGASINVAHDNAMDISPPCTPMMPMSSPSSPITPTLPLLSQERAQSATPSLPPTPRLSILSSTQTRLPVAGTSSTVQATMYKSTYRSASLVKRNREVEDPPSVLDGRDPSELDEVSLKRAKNTDAARRSRHKKLVRMESLEQRVAELEVENSMFESKLNEVELERSLLADKDHMQQARIQELELVLASLREKLY